MSASREHSRTASHSAFSAYRPFPRTEKRLELTSHPGFRRSLLQHHRIPLPNKLEISDVTGPSLTTRVKHTVEQSSPALLGSGRMLRRAVLVPAQPDHVHHLGSPRRNNRRSGGVIPFYRSDKTELW